ncbi:MAG: hypothetical protein ABFD29_03105 [Anaerolineaceae bacterium]|jgi:tetratricopeptide (TPR) repeat protein
MDSLLPLELAKKAESCYKDEDFQQAAELYARAAQTYMDLGEPANAAEMKNNQSVALLQAGDAQNAYFFAKGTDLTFAEAGDKRRQAMALGNQAAALEELKKKDEALKLYQEAALIFEEINEKDLRAYVLKRISALQVRNGKQLNALASMNAALINKEKLTFQEKILKWLTNTVFKLFNRA